MRNETQNLQNKSFLEVKNEISIKAMQPGPLEKKRFKFRENSLLFELFWQFRIIRAPMQGKKTETIFYSNSYKQKVADWNQQRSSLTGSFGVNELEYQKNIRTCKFSKFQPSKTPLQEKALFIFRNLFKNT